MFLVLEEKAASGKELHGARLLSVFLAESDVFALLLLAQKVIHVFIIFQGQSQSDRLDTNKICI